MKKNLVSTLLVLFAVGLGTGAAVASIWAWRVAERAAVAKTTVATSFLWLDFRVSRETAIFVLVVAFAALGSVVHISNSLASYLGNGRFSARWTAWYLLRPVIAVALGLVAYVVFRAGFLSSSASTTDVNLFGVAAVAGLTGIFSKQVGDKLQDVVDVVFASKADQERDDKLGPAVTITELDPTGAAVGATVTLAVVGTGFVEGLVVLVGEVSLTPSSLTPERIEVGLDPAALAAAGSRPVKVRLPSGEESNELPFTVT